MKQLLQEIIKAWWAEPLPVVKPRATDLSNYFDPKIKKIISVIGFRRSGKTFTLYDFARKLDKERCVYLNFEDERFSPSTKLLTQLIEVIRELRGSQPLVLLLDEIQEIPNWSLWARRINETTPYHLILSGSSSKLSSKEIPTELRGQTLSVQIFPLSWSEFLTFKNLSPHELPTPQSLNLLREYLTFGGLPEIVLAEEGIKPLLLAEYYNTFVLRDIIERYRLRNPEALRDLLRLLLNTRTYTFSKIANSLKSLGHAVGKATVIRYLKWLESSFFFASVEICLASVKKRIQAAKKAYVIDNYFSTRFSSQFSQNLGHLMEQLVWQALNRRKFYDPLLEIFYWKDYSQNEVDFVIKRSEQTEEIIQVTYARSAAEIPAREISSMLKAAADLNCQKLTIITWELAARQKINNFDIACVPLWQWLQNGVTDK